MTKTALITGITGQDGSYLARFLLEKDYTVHGIIRRASQFNTARIDDLYSDAHDPQRRLFLHYGDMTDGLCLSRLATEVRPDEIYNLAAQSHVKVSFETPEYTGDVDAIGAMRLLEAVRSAGLANTCRVYQASTSELYGKVRETPQKETTPFYPCSPYAVAKLYAYWAMVNYRESYDMFTCNGILFNHESPMRGETFVTRKITRAVVRIKLGMQRCLYLGNMNAMRDWGHARDYVKAMWMMLQQDQPGDYVIASGKQHSVRQFIEIAFAKVGLTIRWEGEGVDEKGYAVVPGPNGEAGEEQVVVAVDPAFFRPAEVETLLGDWSKARKVLGWKPETSFEQLVEEMVTHDMRLAQQALLIEQHGYAAPQADELDD